MPDPWKLSRLGWCGFGQPDLVKGVPAHAGWVELDDLCGSLPSQTIL